MTTGTLVTYQYVVYRIVSIWQYGSVVIATIRPLGCVHTIDIPLASLEL